MSLHVLDGSLRFPPADTALSDGLLAMGGDLSIPRLILAYQSGIFPWYEGDVPLWWCPDPRFVLFPDELKVSKSMQAVIKSNTFEYRFNTAFEAVIGACKKINRKDQEGTWITTDLEAAFIQLHHLGYAFSAEAWQEDVLVGGLYGIRMGNVFFGESMFSKISNASKFAFIHYVHQLQTEGVALIDCQVYTNHLASMGARMIEREKFLALLTQLL